MFSRVSSSLQLIDFGRSIDLKLFPQGKSFAYSFAKGDMKTTEMLEGKLWNYQVSTSRGYYDTGFCANVAVPLQLDYFGIASTVHVLLTGQYMQLVKNAEGQYFPSGTLRR